MSKIFSKTLEQNIQLILPKYLENDDDCFLVEIKQEKIAPPIEKKEGEQFQVSNEAQRRILELEDELQHTRENLQALIEELETTNEEQQASNEELTSSNEELQSTNEELHSVNEELHTVNSEYQSKIQELIQLNNDVDNLLHSTDIGVIFLDNQLKIRKSTPAISEIISLRSSDIERPLKDFSLKVECPNLMSLLEQVLTEREALEIEVKHLEDQHYYLMRIHPYQTEDFQNDGVVMSFVKIDDIKAIQLQLETLLYEKKRQLAAIETASDGIAILNEDRFIYLNQAHLEIFGYSKPEDLIGKSWRTLYDEAELNRLETEVLPILIKQGNWRGITQAKHRDGHLFDEELTLNFTEAGDLICICRDITSRLQAQRALEANKAELEQRVAQRTEVLGDFSNRLKQLHRLSTGSYPDLTHLFTDYLQTGCQMLGMSTGMIGKVEEYSYQVIAVESPLEVAVKSEYDCQDTYCSEVASSLNTVSYHRVGEVEWMQNHPVYVDLKLESFIGTPIFVNERLYGTLHFADPSPKENPFSREEREIVELMAQDIGQSISAVENQTALRNSEKLYRSTFEQSAMGIAHLTTTGRFIKVNSRFCQIIGYSTAELLQKEFADITYPEDLAVDVTHVKRMLAGEIHSYTREKRYLSRDNSIVWGNVTVTLVKEESEQAQFFVAILEDISDRKQKEAVIEESKLNQEKLKLVNQAKDAFIAHMSHELRTPLNSILGFSSILQNNDTINPKEHQAIDIIHQSGQHLLDLINDILDFSKINAHKLQLEPQSFDLYQFLADINTAFQLRAQQKGLIFINELSPNLPQVINADMTRLRQVLYNLLSNAIKFTETGSVTLKVTTKFEIPELQTEEQSSIVKIRFAIGDTGIGIPESQFKTIFTPFQQLEGIVSNYQGTGLGLTICQKMVQLMGGKIELASQPSVGSTFWFDLELEEVESGFTNILSAPSSQLDYRLKSPKKILVVDDNDANRALLVSYLEPLGFTIAEASNGEIGLSMAETFQPEAILVDLVMPILNGQEMIAQIQQRPKLQNTVIIIISANSKAVTNSPSNIKVNYQGFLPKPVDLEQLRSMLDTHLNLNWQLVSKNQSLETDSFSALELPPQEQLEKLLSLVNLGNLEEIEHLLQSLELTDQQYTIFTKKVRDFVDSCQQNQLETMLKKEIK